MMSLFLVLKTEQRRQTAKFIYYWDNHVQIVGHTLSLITGRYSFPIAPTLQALFRDANFVLFDFSILPKQLR